MDKESNVVAPEIPETPVEFLVADKAKVRSKIKALDFVAALFLLILSGCMLAKMIISVGFESIFGTPLNLAAFCAYCVTVVFSIALIVLALSGCRRAVNAIYYLGAFGLVAYVSARQAIPFFPDFSGIDAENIVLLALLSAGLLLTLIAFILTLNKSKSLGLALFRFVLAALGILPALFLAVYPQVVKGIGAAVTLYGGTVDLLAILQLAAFLSGVVFLSVAIASMGMRFLDRGSNVDTLKKVEVVQQVVAENPEVPATPVRRVIWVGRRKA